MIITYIKIASRHLYWSKDYSHINIGVISVGMTVSFLIGLWIYDNLSFNMTHQKTIPA